MPDIHARRLFAPTLSRCKRAGLCGLLILSAPPVPLPAARGQQQKAIVIDDFESGTLASWKIERSGAGGWFVYTNGKTPPNASESDPNFPFAVPNPPQGKFAAVTDMNGPGRRILYRDVKLDGRYMLRLTVFYVNAGPLSSPNTLDYEVPARISNIALISSRRPRRLILWLPRMCWRTSSGLHPAMQTAGSRPP